MAADLVHEQGLNNEPGANTPLDSINLIEQAVSQGSPVTGIMLTRKIDYNTGGIYAPVRPSKVLKQTATYTIGDSHTITAELAPDPQSDNGDNALVSLDVEHKLTGVRHHLTANAEGAIVETSDNGMPVPAEGLTGARLLTLLATLEEQRRTAIERRRIAAERAGQS